MSRIRSIHPGLWTDEAFVTLSPMARLLLIGMWNECDDKGTFPWSPLQLKMRVLPADNVDAAALLGEIEAAGFVMKYAISGKNYGAVRNFMKFQRPKKPNNIHPATAEVLAFCGSNGEIIGEQAPEVANQFPTASELCPQMEEGGGRMEEIEELPPNGGCASGDAPSLKPEHIVEEWNATAKRLGKPQVRNLTPERRQLLKARIAQYELDDFLNVFGKIERSPFLRGDTGWTRCTFDWIFKKANFQKALEGNYDN
jgi:hypothetical protein